MVIDENSHVVGFSELALAEPVHKALADVGYVTPTPIQALTIPYMLEGRDVIGQAQTGTGKTAAFALPLLSRIDPANRAVQVLVLAPTRELAIQVAAGFTKYAAHVKGLNVLPIYGGSEYGGQLRALRRGVQVVVGTPGRVMDHMRRGTLKLDNLSCLVLDEADEMLRMGFIDDVEWILEQTPAERQTALFSATMPRPIRNIAQKHMRDPKELIIESRTTAATSIRQRYLVVNMHNKADALVRILEMEKYDGVIVFVKTKAQTIEVAEKLVSSGHSACALNGDLAQSLRERTINKLKSGQHNILVATDVAARGLDVDRISHVINFDAPFDAETYVHRIGRTGRAGRTGEAILFLTPRDKRILHNISRATQQKIESMDVPTPKAINKHRIDRLQDQITETLANTNTRMFSGIIEAYCETHGADQLEVSAALAHLMQGNKPLLLSEETRTRRPRPESNFASERPREPRRQPAKRVPTQLEPGMDRYRVDVGMSHGVRPANIVGAIVNEAGIGGDFIGRIGIYADHSTVDMPEGMPKNVLRQLRKVWVCNTQLNMALENSSEPKANKPVEAEKTERTVRKPRGESRPRVKTKKAKPKRAVRARKAVRKKAA